MKKVKTWLWWFLFNRKITTLEKYRDYFDHKHSYIKNKPIKMHGYWFMKCDHDLCDVYDPVDVDQIY